MHDNTRKRFDLEERIKALETQNKALEARLEKLMNGLSRVSKNSFDYDMMQDRHLKILDRSHEEAFERIKHLEMSLFPGIGEDMNRVYGIIGDHEAKADEPLDRRAP